IYDKTPVTFMYQGLRVFYLKFTILKTLTLYNSNLINFSIRLQVSYKCQIACIICYSKTRGNDSGQSSIIIFPNYGGFKHEKNNYLCSITYSFISSSCS